jgi:capping protein (actin filament) muscle Z-line, beta
MLSSVLTGAEEVYFGKAKDVVGDLRSELLLGPAVGSDVVLTRAGIPPLTEANRDIATHRDMIKSMNR